MKLYKYPPAKEWPVIVQRPHADLSAIEESVTRILKKVRKKGDKAVFKYTKKFDGAELTSLLVTDNEINQAESLLEEELKTAIWQAKKILSYFISAKKRK